MRPDTAISISHPLPSKFAMGAVRCSSCSIAQLLDAIRWQLTKPDRAGCSVLCLNSHIYNLSFSDSRLRDVLNTAWITAADGMAIVWAGRLFGGEIRERCNMTEAYHAFLSDVNMPKSRAILIGCSEVEALAAARAANQSVHCQVVQSYSGFFEESEYEKIFKEHAEVDLILLGMGTPRTEFISEIARRCCPRSMVWGIGGGTIRIDAGTMVEAPVFWRRAGLQWLFRLWKEPAALWRRYLIGNPLFIIRVFKEAFFQRIAGKK